MIQIFKLQDFDDALFCPAIVCDQCGRRCENPREAIVVWTAGETAGPVYHLHKGACDRAFTEKHGRTLWVTVAEHLAQLNRNAGVGPDLPRRRQRDLLGRRLAVTEAVDRQLQADTRGCQ